VVNIGGFPNENVMSPFYFTRIVSNSGRKIIDKINPKKLDDKARKLPVETHTYTHPSSHKSLSQISQDNKAAQ